MLNKNLFLFLAFFANFFCLHAQEPISESNSYIYNKQNYGFDFFNVAHVFPNGNGSLCASPYADNNITLGNVYAYQTFKNNDRILALQILQLGNRRFTFNDTKFFEILPNHTLKNIYATKSYENINGGVVFNGKFFMMNTDIKNRNNIIFSFDGSSFQRKLILDSRFYDSGFSIFNNAIHFIKRGKKEFTVLKIEGNRLIPEKTFPYQCVHTYFINLDEFYFEDTEHFLCFYNNGKVSKIYKIINNIYAESMAQGIVNQFDKNNLYLLKIKKEKIDTVANISNVSNSYNHLYNKETNSYYVGTGTNFYRLFPYIKKYPKVFNKSNSQQIFSIVQAKDGKIWAGSYNGTLSYVDKKKITEGSHKKMIMNGALSVGNKILVNNEGEEGIELFDDEVHYRKINDTIISFYNFLSRDSTLYCGTASWGLMYAKWKDVISNKKISWKFIDFKKGNLLKNNVCIAEDKFGNIWSAQRGISVYQPYKGKAITWNQEKNDTDIKSKAMVTDNRKTLWLGTYDGRLFYYDGKNRDDLSLKNLKQILHPLLSKNKIITFIHQWKNYLIIGASDKILLFDLDKWYAEKKVFVRYLNAMETNFSAPTEQNTILTDFRDESIWFSTSDMLYQWNIKDWLKLPTFKVNPEIIFKKGSIEKHLLENQKLSFKPRENTLEFDIQYQTKDNMPRYISATLVKEDEKPVFDAPNLTTHFKFSNLRSGSYIFYIQVCQQDGSFTIHKFYLKIEKFLWQNWWFWLAVSLLSLAGIYYYFYTRKKIMKQQKEIAQLNLISLGKQFRPHFMLNALNSLGSDMRDKPHAEKIISRIGENINIMHKFAKENHIDIDFEHEWKLTLNTIEIQKEIFIKELETKIINKEIIPSNYRLPMGILQVNVENALLHGIRHRKEPPYLLEVKFDENQNYYIVTISDNGVGIENSKTYYDFSKNGTGISNLKSVIKIINNNIPDAFIVKMENLDDNNKTQPGTKTTIMMKKIINYEKFKI